MLWNIPKVWNGQTVVIIGGGPSILEQFNVPKEVRQLVFDKKAQPDIYSPYLEPLHNLHVIAVNEAYKLGDWVDILFFGDAAYMKANKEQLLRFKGLRVTCAEGQPADRRFKFLKRHLVPKTDNYGISTEQSTLCWNNNSGSAAINLAVQLGAKKVILFGFDMKVDEGKNQHWHKAYKGDPRLLPSTFRKHLTPFSKIAEDLEMLGVEVINCSPDSEITVFPKMNFKDIVL